MDIWVVVILCFVASMMATVVYLGLIRILKENCTIKVSAKCTNSHKTKAEAKTKSAKMPTYTFHWNKNEMIVADESHKCTLFAKKPKHNETVVLHINPENTEEFYTKYTIHNLVCGLIGFLVLTIFLATTFVLFF